MYDGDWNLFVRNDRYRQHFDLPTDDYWKMATSAGRCDHASGLWRRLAPASVGARPGAYGGALAADFSPPQRPGHRFADLPVAGGGLSLPAPISVTASIKRPRPSPPVGPPRRRRALEFPGYHEPPIHTP